MDLPIWHGDQFKDARSEGSHPRPAGGSPPSAGRPSIQVWFECVGVYQRVFRSVDGSGYLARCAKCGKTMQFRVGAGGTTKRIFAVSC